MKVKHDTSGTVQFIVPTPKWVQRYVLRNLKNESRNRVSSDRAARAEAILQELDLRDKERHPQEKIPLQSNLPIEQVKTPTLSKHKGILKKVFEGVKKQYNSVLQWFRKKTQ